MSLDPTGSHHEQLPIENLPMMVLVGVTGVGKSTSIEALRRTGRDLALLPNRRQLTDDLIISYMQKANGDPVKQIRDRSLRFNYTAAYRKKFPSGMAHALSQMTISPDTAGLLFFDGLRGQSEVSFAVEKLPKACFVVLEAPTIVRLKRLLDRGDQFDHVQVSHDTRPVDLGDYATLFNTQERNQIQSWVDQDAVTLVELQSKLKIIKQELDNYDPVATRNTLQQQAPDRMLAIDTSVHDPDAIAMQINQFLKGCYAN